LASNIADFISWAVEYIFLEAGRMEEELEKWIRAFRGDRQLKEYVVKYIEDEQEFAQDLLKRARFLKKKFRVRSCARVCWVTIKEEILKVASSERR
jgi:hypothetical protein